MHHLIGCQFLEFYMQKYHWKSVLKAYPTVAQRDVKVGNNYDLDSLIPMIRFAYHSLCLTPVLINDQWSYRLGEKLLSPCPTFHVMPLSQLTSAMHSADKITWMQFVATPRFCDICQWHKSNTKITRFQVFFSSVNYIFRPNQGSAGRARTPEAESPSRFFFVSECGSLRKNSGPNPGVFSWGGGAWAN